MAFKIQTTYADEQWRDLVDSESGKPELYPLRSLAQSEIDDIVESTDATRDEYRVVPDTEPSPE